MLGNMGMRRKYFHFHFLEIPYQIMLDLECLFWSTYNYSIERRVPQKDYFRAENGVSSFRPEDDSKVPEDLWAKLWVVQDIPHPRLSRVTQGISRVVNRK